MTCSKCECLVRVKNKLGYNLYYCGYKKYGVLKALSGLYINNEEYRKNSKTCKYYKGVKQMTNEKSDKKCLNCSRMTVSQDVYISGTEEKITELEKELAESKAENKQIIERERVVPEHYLVEMIEKNKEQKKQITIYKKILEDVFEKYRDLCPLCEKKGQYLPKCECMTTDECMDKLFMLYEGKKE